MVTPAALVMAPPARLIGLLPKNSAGRTPFSRNLCSIAISPLTGNDPLHPPGFPGWPRFLLYGMKRVGVLLQRAEVLDRGLDLIVSQFSSEGLHLVLAVLHR